MSATALREPLELDAAMFAAEGRMQSNHRMHLGHGSAGPDHVELTNKRANAR